MQRRHLFPLFAVIALLAVGLVAFVIYESPLMTTVQLGEEAAAPADVPNVRIGDPMPDFSATAWDGSTFALDALRGTPVLLKFFRGHW